MNNFILWYQLNSKLINVGMFLFVVLGNTLIAYMASVGMMDIDTARRLRFVIAAIAIGNLAMYMKYGSLTL